MAEAQTKEQREAAWWDAWWKWDYSWEGLAKKPLQGWVVAEGYLREAATGRVYGQPSLEAMAAMSGAPATLRDYWRADPATGRLRSDEEMEAELVAMVGEPVFHRVHLPLLFESGQQTGKKNWPDDALDAYVTPRLLIADETKWDFVLTSRRMVGSDFRAQFQGGVWLRAGKHPNVKVHPIRARYGDAFFSRNASFSGSIFEENTRFDRAMFAGYARFNNVVFAGDVSFSEVSFVGEAELIDSEFVGGARLNTVSFWSDARFTRARFLGFVHFFNATFQGRASFEDAEFSDEARFVEAKFFENAVFKRAKPAKDAVFKGAEFRKETSMEGVRFGGSAVFDDATFCGPAHFTGCTFFARSNFQRAGFRDIGWFDNVTFHDVLNFQVATFDRLASFSGLTWPIEVRDWHGAFNQTEFRGSLNLSGTPLQCFAAFDGAALVRGLKFDETTERAARDRFRFERDGAFAAAAIDVAVFKLEEAERRRRVAEAENVPAKSIARAEVNAHLADQREKRLGELERGCRVLKQTMEQASNKSREHLFYRFELQARRAQRNLPLGEKTFSWLYAMSSDYGASMWRPFAALAVLIAAFAGVFYGWGYGFDPAALKADGWNGLFQALDLSWSNVFKPLSALSTENDFRDKNALAFRLLYNDAGGVDGQGFAVRAVSTLQSLLALVLAFLFALAVRRRFQIS